MAEKIHLAQKYIVMFHWHCVTFIILGLILLFSALYFSQKRFDKSSLNIATVVVFTIGVALFSVGITYDAPNTVDKPYTDSTLVYCYDEIPILKKNVRIVHHQERRAKGRKYTKLVTRYFYDKKHISIMEQYLNDNNPKRPWLNFDF